MTDTEQQITGFRTKALDVLDRALGTTVARDGLEAAKYVLDTCMRVEQEAAEMASQQVALYGAPPGMPIGSETRLGGEPQAVTFDADSD